MGLFGKELQFRMCNHRQTIRKLEIKEAHTLQRENRRSGGTALKESPLEESKSSGVALVSHWLSCGIFFLIEIVSGQGAVPPSSCWESKVGFSLLWPGRQESFPNWLHSSILNGISFTHFHIIQIRSSMLQFLTKDTDSVCRWYQFLLFSLPKLSIQSSCFCNLRMWNRPRERLLMHLFINPTKHEAATIPRALF